MWNASKKHLTNKNRLYLRVNTLCLKTKGNIFGLNIA